MHLRARDEATNATITKFGPDSVPVKPGSEPHGYWLNQYDKAMRKELYGSDLFAA